MAGYRKKHCEACCPNDGEAMITSRFKDLCDAEGRCFTVWITYCLECGYIHNCTAE